MELAATTVSGLIDEQILKTAKHLFASLGLGKVTIDDIAKAIGKTRGSIYYYYKNKYEILDAVIHTELIEVRIAMEKQVNSAHSTEAKIKAFIGVKLQMARQKHLLFDKLEADKDSDAMTNFDRIKVTFHNDTLNWESNLLKNILSQGMINGELKERKEDALDGLIFLLLGTIHGVKREMQLENHKRDLETVVLDLTQMILHGLIH